MPPKYRKHLAVYHVGDYLTSYVCVCMRQADHPVAERKEPARGLALFDLTEDGEMRVC